MKLLLLLLFGLLLFLTNCFAQWPSIDAALNVATGSLPKVHLCEKPNATIVAEQPLMHTDQRNGTQLSLRITILEVILPHSDTLRVVALVQNEHAAITYPIRTLTFRSRRTGSLSIIFSSNCSTLLKLRAICASNRFRGASTATQIDGCCARQNCRTCFATTLPRATPTFVIVIGLLFDQQNLYCGRFE
jgi:hypothetical protein